MELHPLNFLTHADDSLTLEEQPEEEDIYSYVEERVYEAETLAPSTQMGQNVGKEVGHNIDIFSSRATYDYPTKSTSLRPICNFCPLKRRRTLFRARWIFPLRWESQKEEENRRKTTQAISRSITFITH